MDLLHFETDPNSKNTNFFYRIIFNDVKTCNGTTKLWQSEIFFATFWEILTGKCKTGLGVWGKMAYPIFDSNGACIILILIVLAELLISQMELVLVFKFVTHELLSFSTWKYIVHPSLLSMTAIFLGFEAQWLIF